MKLKMRYLYILVTVVLMSTLAGCFDMFDFSYTFEINGVIGASDVLVDGENKHLSFSVSPDISTFDVSGIQTGYDDAINITPKKNNSTLTSNIVELNFGDNDFLIIFSGDITYLGREYTVNEEWTLTIKRLSTSTLTSIAVQSWKTDYFVGDEFSAGELALIYDDGNRYIIPLTRAMVIGFDTSVSGTYDVTISYAGLTVDKQITVSALEENLVSFEVTAWTSNYYVAESFKNGSLLLTFTSGATKVIDLTVDMVSGFDTSVAGEFSVTITYGGITSTQQIIVEERNIDDYVEVSEETILDLIVKCNLLFEYGIVEGDDNYESEYERLYNGNIDDSLFDTFYYGCLESYISEETVLNLIEIVDNNFPYYRDLVLDIIELTEEENPVLAISEYLFNDWDRHTSVINEIVSLISSEQFADFVMFGFSTNNNSSINGYTKEQYLSFVEGFEGSELIVEVMEKFFVNSTYEYGSNSDWKTFFISGQEILTIFTSFEKAKLELIVEVVSDIMYNFENISTANLALAVNYLGELCLDINAVLPSMEFFFDYASSIGGFLIYPQSVVELIANVMINFSADDMLYVIDMIKDPSEYIIIEMLHYFSGDILNEITNIYGDNFVDEIAKIISLFEHISVDDAATYVQSVYNFIIELNNTTLTDTNKEELNERFNQLFDEGYLLFENKLYISYSNDGFILETGLTEEEFYTFLNDNVYLNYDGMSLMLSPTICSSIDLNLAGLQYVVINIDSTICQIPIFFYNGNTSDLELLYFRINFDSNHYYDDSDVIVYDDEVNEFFDTYYSTRSIYLHKESGLILVHSYEELLSNESEIDLEIVGLDTSSSAVQKVLFKIQHLSEDYVYVPVNLLLCNEGETIVYNIRTFSTFYIGVNSIDEIGFSIYTISKIDGYFHQTVEHSVCTVISEINTSVYGYQQIEILYNGMSYTVELDVQSYSAYILNNNYDIIQYESDIVSSDDLYFYTRTEVSDAQKIGDVYRVSYSKIVSLLEADGYYNIYLEEYDHSNDIYNKYSYYLNYSYNNYNYSVVFCRIYVYIYHEELTINNVTKITNDYENYTFFTNNTFTIEDCDDINSGAFLDKYMISYYAKGSIYETTTNLSYFLNSYSASILIDVNNSELIIIIDGVSHKINIYILYSVVPVSLSVSSSSNFSYYYNLFGYVYIDVEYCDLETGIVYCRVYEKIAISNVDSIDSSSTGWQYVRINIYGMDVYVEIYVYSYYEINNVTGNTIYYYQDISDIDNLSLNLTFEYSYNYNDYYYTNSLTVNSSQYEILNKSEIDLAQTGYVTLNIKYQEFEFQVTMIIKTVESFFTDIISSQLHRTFLNTTLNDIKLYANGYIQNATELFDLYNNVSSYQIKIIDFISYAATKGITITVSNIDTTTIGYKKFTITINSVEYTRSIFVNKVYEHHGYILGELSISAADVDKIVSLIDLDLYIANVYKFDSSYSYNISLAELYIYYGARFTKVDGNLIINMQGVEYTITPTI